LEAARGFTASPITAVHLWFDRPIMPCEHAVLVGRLSQWVFHHRRRTPHAPREGVYHAEPEGARHAEREDARHAERDEYDWYYQVVISGSHRLEGGDRQAIVDAVCQELQATWPQAREATRLRWRMVTEPEAVFSYRPGLDAQRPAQQTPVSNLLVAGDWTRTGWPATMEGAVRSGYLAVEALLETLGRRESILAADLPRSLLCRWLT
jgi:uncharacterized protein with NAD-binding domain and iron-sulfur cluster